MRRSVVIGAVVALALVLGGLAWTMSHRSGGSGRTTSPAFVEPASPSPTVASTSHTTSCPDTVAHSFTPTTITVTGVATDVHVITPPRDAHHVPGVPPLTEAGKHVFAYDREQRVRPGDAQGNVLLNAHTWPDGTALGNQLLTGLHDNGRIVVRGTGAQRLCYRVTRRVEVLATADVPAYYSRTGTPQLAVIVCSGRRLGPGQWEKRTIWYASPSS